MAIVMALGIMTQGVLLNFFGFRRFFGIVGEFLSIMILALWGLFSFSFLLSYFNKKFKTIHYEHPINRFGIGTWVAGTSICGILIYKQFMEWAFISQILLSVNILLWVIYIGGSVRAFYELNQNLLSKNVHGILLLTTVSTQSIVLLLSTVDQNVPSAVDIVLIAVGICFYLISTFFIIKRYVTTESWTINTDWNNTNCILHGALSITGLACVVSHVLSKQGVVLIWIMAAIVFLIIESIELYRLFNRLKQYGMKKGILIYDVSQWSRIFTFGMFYTITFQSDPKPFFLTLTRKVIITIGIWPIIILGIFELFLCVKQYSKTYKKLPLNM
ncbi:hypothetical protein [Neobacillus endophyticus]|uniref:hypothetical protein n=1 Tax=Neobacillus endophyticus TaxID=2738405 RepID=UPI001FEA0E82|nr:hypothetical protein [Neobacillus endophyticus]